MRYRGFAARTASILALVLLVVWGTARGEERGKGADNEHAAGIVASMIKAYGGTDAIRKVVSVTAKGRITDFVTGKSGEYARYFEHPGKLRIEVMPEQKGEVRILNKGRGWQATGKGFVPVTDLELQSMLYQYSYLNLPMALINGSYHARYGGKQLYQGKETQLLLVEPKDAPTMGVLVDAKTSLIVRIDAIFGVGMGGTGKLSTEYGDYRPVAGVQFPFRLTTSAGGLRLAGIVLDDIAINRKIPPELFMPPAVPPSEKPGARNHPTKANPMRKEAAM
ncbi:hypothetical protein L4X63_15675 [Geomonas sp. Red32]|uniref:hypothetical protein n=1 Tax=Geomonas sp. Red32 TaxID=2912856 RepID=UPI00202CC03D|nr:hypothetical protein [Geomonas sp. Red32]MCM0083032.1 hypothetical protein [Geomonas sp. Red32]